MAVDIKNIAIGAAVLSLGDWVTAGGAGSLTDVGLTLEGSMLSIATEFFDVSGEQVIGKVRSVPTSMTVTVKAKLQEASLDNLRRAINQPSANLTGTAPNKSLLVGEPSEQYLQGTLVTKGIAGSTSVHATRTITFWRGVVKSIGEISYSKGGNQVYDVEIECLEDTSVSTADKFFKIVDTSGA